jgi:hypothetical protein
VRTAGDGTPPDASARPSSTSSAPARSSAAWLLARLSSRCFSCVTQMPSCHVLVLAKHGSHCRHCGSRVASGRHDTACSTAPTRTPITCACASTQGTTRCLAALRALTEAAGVLTGAPDCVGSGVSRRCTVSSAASMLPADWRAGPCRRAGCAGSAVRRRSTRAPACPVSLPQRTR